MKKLSVVGCGTVGSELLYLFAHRCLEKKCKFNILEFVDPDVVTDENSVSNGYPKVLDLEDKINDINPHIILRPIIDIYPDFLDKQTDIEKKNTIFIDCRDNAHKSNIFYMKIASDGPYGKIIKYPSESTVSEPVLYSLKNSKYYSKMTVMQALEDICNIKFPLKRDVEKIFILNHTINKLC